MTNYKKLIELIDVKSSFDLLRSTDNLEFNSILDVGFGKGGASLYFAQKGKNVTSIGLNIDSYGYPKEEFEKAGIRVLEEDFLLHSPEKKYDAIYMQHILEHTQNPGLFLDKAKNLLNDDGWLFVMVPPYKSQIVGGHATTGWNPGTLMYNLLLAGFDIKNGHFIKHHYNVCGFVQKSQQKLPELCFDNGDIEKTAHLWPVEVCQGFNGELEQVNWFDNFDLIKDEHILLGSDIPEKIVNFLDKNKEKRICFYGAGQFANLFVKHYDLSEYNIPGFIDKDDAKINTSIGNYPIYSIKKINELKPDILVITILKPEIIIPEIKQHIEQKNINLQIFPSDLY